ncbi:MAG: hypothetical protein HDS13_00665 [Bacteroides sp.]|nr:hypothetical protein [Bacteroides sp.]
MERLTYILQRYSAELSLSVIYRFKNIAVALFCILYVHVCSAKTIQSKYHFQTEDAVFDSIAGLVFADEVNRTNDSRVPGWIEKMKEIASRSHNPVLEARSVLWQIRSTQLNASPDSCIVILEQARGKIPKSYEYDYACLSYQLAGNHDRIGNYFNTYQLLQEAIPIFEKYGDDYFLGNAHLLLGLMYSSIADYDQAVEEINLADRHYSAYGYPANRIAYFKATLSKDEKEKVRLYKEAVEQGSDDPGMTIQAYEQLATIYNARKESDSAMYYLQLGKSMRAEMVPDNILLKIILNIQEAEVLYSRKEYDKALALLKETEAIAPYYRNEYWEPAIYKYMARIYENKGDNQQAFSYLKKYLNAYERQINTFRGQEVPKAKAREAIQRQKVLITNMEQETRNARNRFIIILLVLIAVIILAAAVFLYFQQRIKMKRMENRELRTNLEQEMIIKRLNLENFERDIKQKDCEISSSVLLLSNKNDVLQQIRVITKRYSDDGRIPREFVDQVNSLVSDSLKGDDEWSRFKIHFDSVHPDFFTKLKKASDELTENDLRLCAYIKIGMRAKDIASMLSVSPASVNTNRYRIRRKLNLSKEDSLDDYIRKI